MIKIKTITLRNFLSFGNVTQSMNIDIDGLTLILGDNLDLGGAGNKNGAGKTSLIQGISYALFGQPLTNIKKDNLVNSINGKDMLVTLEYEVNKKKYRIERGRKPNVLRFYVDDGLVTDPNSSEAQGESKWTQREIEKSISLSHTMFKTIVVLHTKTTPFLNLSDRHQREIIEELMGITALSRKAECLKEEMREIKAAIRDEEVRIATVKESNEKIQKHINDLLLKSRMWDKSHQTDIEARTEAIVKLEHLDIEKELEAHTARLKWAKLDNTGTSLLKEIGYLEKSIDRLDSQRKKSETELKKIKSNTCPTCQQKLHGNTEDMKKKVTDTIEKYTTEHAELVSKLEELAIAYEKVITEQNEAGNPETYYETMAEAYEHKNVLDKKLVELETQMALTNPYVDQIANLNTSSIQEISVEYLEELSLLKEHQEFLFKLLTNKDSFIRKKIIDLNLNFLNLRLNEYLTKLLLPHEVVFNSDLSVTISNLGKEYDFDQLSNGESNRVILSLAWAFRDVWENLNNPLNISIIDELVDSGLDNQGTDASLSVLKRMAHEKGKNVFLISHKDGLETRVDNVLTVQKESGFSSFSLS